MLVSRDIQRLWWTSRLWGITLAEECLCGAAMHWGLGQLCLHDGRHGVLWDLKANIVLKWSCRSQGEFRLSLGAVQNRAKLRLGRSRDKGRGAVFWQPTFGLVYTIAGVGPERTGLSTPWLCLAYPCPLMCSKNWKILKYSEKSCWKICFRLIRSGRSQAHWKLRACSCSQLGTLVTKQINSSVIQHKCAEHLNR